MKDEYTKNLFWQAQAISRADREQQSGHRSGLLWFIGLSGAGKTTLSQAVAVRLHQLGCRTIVLDGDNIRHGLCSDLGFSAEDRSENVRRVGEVVKLFVGAGVITLAAFILSTAKDREFVKRLLGDEDYFEIYRKCSLGVCESRDVNGIDKKARSGDIKNFTGIDLLYEEPINPDLIVDTDAFDIEHSTLQIMNLLKTKGLLSITIKPEYVS